MGWIKDIQSAIPWLVSLPILPKIIISLIIVGIAALALILMWTPPPETAVATILQDCYRRALFTRMHAQLDDDAMFFSIAKCRESIQKNLPAIRNKHLNDIAVELLATVENIERLKPGAGDDAKLKINKLKLASLHSFRELARLTGGNYTLPNEGKLGEAVYFTQTDADAPVSPNDLRNQNTIDPATEEIASQKSTNK